MPNIKPELLRAGVFYFSGGLQARLVRVIRKTGLAATFLFSMPYSGMVFFGSHGHNGDFKDTTVTGVQP